VVSYFVRRALAVVPVLILISIGIFLLVRLAPGDPVMMQLDPEVAGSDPTYVERRRAELGLDKPIPIQYFAWAGEVLQGNLGFSFVSRRPVLEMVVERIMPTVRLMGTGIGIGLIIAIPLGIIAALRKNTAADYATAVVSLSAISIPNFFLGLAAIFVFGLTLGWLPTSGMGSGGFWESIRYLIMPAGILGFGLSGPLVRYVRSGLLDELNKDYVQTAIAKGAIPDACRDPSRAAELTDSPDHRHRHLHPPTPGRSGRARTDLRLARHGQARLEFDRPA
jgi:ABC-type dipeptide/oligopeptide/nickel transport system permease component